MLVVNTPALLEPRREHHMLNRIHRILSSALVILYSYFMSSTGIMEIDPSELSAGEYKKWRQLNANLLNVS